MQARVVASRRVEVTPGNVAWPSDSPHRIKLGPLVRSAIADRVLRAYSAIARCFQVTISHGTTFRRDRGCSGAGAAETT